MPTFSVIMPVWNRADIVSKSIKSVLSQTFNDYELIIVDDGSEDNLEAVVRPYLSHKVAYYRIPHSGVSRARNFALFQAKGEFIAYLDSDVIWHPAFLYTVWAALSTSGRVEAAYCMYNYFVADPDTGVVRFEGVKGGPFDFKRLITQNYIDMSTFVHARRCIDVVGVHDESIKSLVDWDYILRITSVFDPIFVPVTLVDYYVGVAKNAITTTNLLTRAFAHQYIVRKHRDEVLRVIGRRGLAKHFMTIAFVFDDAGDFNSCRTYVLKAFNADRGNPLIVLLALWSSFGERVFHLSRPIRALKRSIVKP